MVPDRAAKDRARLRALFGRVDAPGGLLSHFSLGRKVALIPILTLLLMGLMLAVVIQMSDRNTAALRALDRDVFEPLNRAQTIKDEITLLHTRLFELLSTGNNERNPVAQKASAEDLITILDTEVQNFSRFLEATRAVLPPTAAPLRPQFNGYADLVRETANFAAYDASYGALLAGTTDDAFGKLHADLDATVRALEQRRATLADAAVRDSVHAQRLLLIIGVAATALALIGSAVVGRSIAHPVLRLTGLMNRLAAGEIDLVVRGGDRRDEVGAMARAVEMFRANVIARHASEVELRRTNLQFDAALNSMLQGLVVWGPDHRVQLINRRYFAIFGLPEDSIATGFTVADLVDTAMRHGVHLGEEPAAARDRLRALLMTRQSMRLEIEPRHGQFVQVTTKPMSNGGTAISFEDVTETRRNEAQISFMARHDALTGLPNRTLFQEHMDRAVAGASAGQPFAVLCLDLDHFKEVNDTLGHPAGDDLLRQVAGRLRTCVRDGDLIARLGGDEFAIVLSSAIGGPGPPAALAARLVETISAPYDVTGHNIVIGTSVGIALSEPGLPGAELLKRADVALYQAKGERGTFTFYEPGMDRQLLARREIEAELRLALQRNEFELHYQPIYDLVADRVTAFEALVRWNNPRRGRLPPADFIAIAERSGLIVPIGAWVLRTACAEAAAWPDHLRVAVNVSVVQFKNQHLMDLVREILIDTGLPPNRLELEITETVLLQDTDAVLTMLHSLRDLGTRVSMDDFGTGFSSLSYLHRFPFDKVKIDRAFISDLRSAALDGDSVASSADTASAAAKSAAMIVRAIIGLGENLGITTTAEGVETAQQFARVRQEGCTEAQGYFISQPRPARDVLDLLQRLDTSLPAIANGRGAQPRRVA